MLADTFSQVTALARSIVWPVVILVVLIFYNRPLSKFLAGLGGRISRVSFGGASVEFVPASEAPSPMVSAVTEFIDASAAGRIASDAGPSLQAAIYSTGADFVKIDLRGGKAWLTSRLYIFSVIFSETAAVKRIVFVQRSDTGTETFVGIADPLDVADRLGSRFPWFSYALAAAEPHYMDEQPPPNTQSLVRPFTNPLWAAQISQMYLVNPLIRNAPYAAEDGPGPADFSYDATLPPASPSQGILAAPSIPQAGRDIPVISIVAPLTGPRAGGTNVTITGEGFGGLREVRFGSSPAAIFSVSDSQIVAVSPPGNGTARITVVTSAGSSTTTDDWVTVRSSDGTLHAEHAAWIQDGRHLLSLIGDGINTACVKETSRTKRSDLLEQTLREQQDFVAIVDQGNQFRRLIDRRAVMERLARELAESS
jgi:IPT/TIG domain